MFTSDNKRRIVVVESWGLMRKFMEDTIRKMNECKLDKLFSNDNTVEEYIENNDAELLIADISSNNEDRIMSLVKSIKVKRPGIKVILTTLTYSAKLEEKAKKAGVDSVWQKDISEQSFINICRSVV